jgi:hypothetical protein
VKLECQRTDLFGEFKFDEVVDVLGLRRAGDNGCANLRRSPTRVRPARVLLSSSAVRIPAAAIMRACAELAATS